LSGDLPDGESISLNRLPVTVYLPIQELHEVSADRVTLLCYGDTTVANFQGMVLDKLRSLRLPSEKNEEKKIIVYHLEKTLDTDPLDPKSVFFKNFSLKELLSGKLEARLISNAPDPLQGKIVSIEVRLLGKKPPGSKTPEKEKEKEKGKSIIHLSVPIDSFLTIHDIKLEVARKIVRQGLIIRENKKETDSGLSRLSKPSEDDLVNAEMNSFDLMTQEDTSENRIPLASDLNFARALPQAIKKRLTLVLVLKQPGKV